jgi:hypothetical protein
MTHLRAALELLFRCRAGLGIAGVAIMVLYFSYTWVLRSVAFSPLTPEASFGVLSAIIRYTFLLAITAVVLSVAAYALPQILPSFFRAADPRRFGRGCQPGDQCGSSNRGRYHRLCRDLIHATKGPSGFVLGARLAGGVCACHCQNDGSLQALRPICPLQGQIRTLPWVSLLFARERSPKRLASARVARQDEACRRLQRPFDAFQRVAGSAAPACR